MSSEKEIRTYVDLRNKQMVIIAVHDSEVSSKYYYYDRKTKQLSRISNFLNYVNIYNPLLQKYYPSTEEQKEFDEALKEHENKKKNLLKK